MKYKKGKKRMEMKREDGEEEGKASIYYLLSRYYSVLSYLSTDCDS